MDLLFGFWRRALEALRCRAIRRFCRDTAEARGRLLLRHWLSAEQRAQFDELNYFEVVGCATGKRYRIHYAAFGNIEEMDEAGNPRLGWCFVPVGGLVPGDVMLAQKIALETDELAALVVAHRFGLGFHPTRANRRPF
jgi:hypothetical protein